MAYDPRRPGGQFVKGRSGNPGGRPKGLAARWREKVNYDEICDYLLDLVRGKVDGVSVPVEHRDRIQAAKVLLDRGWGKPEQVILTERPAEKDLSGISLEELLEIERKLGGVH